MGEIHSVENEDNLPKLVDSLSTEVVVVVLAFSPFFFIRSIVGTAMIIVMRITIVIPKLVRGSYRSNIFVSIAHRSRLGRCFQ